MNERIKELKNQCWVDKHWDNGMWVEKHIDLELFAELIVRECANVASSITPPIVSDLILEHFGVEE